jgi:hypothetical protein
MANQSRSWITRCCQPTTAVAATPHETNSRVRVGSALSSNSTLHRLARSSPVRIGAFAAPVLAASLLLAQNAAAAPVFSEAGSFAVGVEDVTGYYSRTLKYDNEQNLSREYSQNRLGIALVNGAVHVGIHYFLIPHLSLGGFVGYESAPSSVTMADPPGTYTTDQPTENHLILAPRVGYALMFTEQIGLWFRGGIGYQRDKYGLGGDNYARDSLGVLSADILFAWSPVPHLAIVVGPTGDISFTGSHYEHRPNGRDWSNDASMHRLAVTSGLYGYF